MTLRVCALRATSRGVLGIHVVAHSLYSPKCTISTSLLVLEFRLPRLLVSCAKRSFGVFVFAQSCAGMVFTLHLQTESASQFLKGERPDLAEQETREAEIISALLPPLLSEAEIDRVIKEVISSCPQDGNPKKALGFIFKSFYSKVDKANVDPDLVKNRAEALLNL